MSIREKYPKLIEKLPEESVRKLVRAVNFGLITKYVFQPSGLSLYVVRGEGGDYLVIRRKYCMCPDFTINVLLRGERDFCYHLAAVEVAEGLGKVRTKVLSDLYIESIVKKVISSRFRYSDR